MWTKIALTCGNRDSVCSYLSLQGEPKLELQSKATELFSNGSDWFPVATSKSNLSPHARRSKSKVSSHAVTSKIKVSPHAGTSKSNLSPPAATSKSNEYKTILFSTLGGLKVDKENNFSNTFLAKWLIFACPLTLWNIDFTPMFPFKSPFKKHLA